MRASAQSTPHEASVASLIPIELPRWSPRVWVHRGCLPAQVGQALLALFVQQYVHLDLKWDNVVVRDGATAADPPLAVVRGRAP